MRSYHKNYGCDHTIDFAQWNIHNAPIFLHNEKSDFPCQKQCMFKEWVYICTICWIFSHLNTTCNSKAMNEIVPLLLHNKNINKAPMFLHSKKSDFPCQKQCMFKMWVYICMIYWIFSQLNTGCKSKAMTAIIPLLLQNKKNIRNASIFFHNKKSDFPCQKQCMFKRL